MKFRDRIFRVNKLAKLTLDTFAERRMGFQCVALSYFMMMAIVPFLAFLFTVTGGLGLQNKLYEVLPSLTPSFGESAMMDLEMKANNIINIAKSGVVGFIGALLFLWTILWLFFQVERVFNNVWGIRKIPRKLSTRFSYYFIVLAFTPFIVIIFGTGIALYANLPGLLGIDVYDLRLITKIFGWIVFWIISALVFACMYKYIPAVNIQFKNAFYSAMLSSAVFVIFQYFYLQTQVFVSRISAVYGAIAAIPLFLIWLNFSWQIIIYGAQLTFSFEKLDTEDSGVITEKKNKKR